MSPKKQVLVAIVVVGIGVVALGIIKYFQISAAMAQHKNFTPPPEAVTSIVAKTEAWPQTLSAIGSLAPSQGVTLSSQEDGQVSKVNFESGQVVKQGDVLVELDNSVEEANLRGAYALAEQTKQNLARAQSLKAKNITSQSDFDDANAKFREAQAAVDSLRALIERKKVIAPFSGHTGIRQINVGQYVSKGTQIVPLHSLDPLYVNFAVPQQDLDLLKVELPIAITIDGFQERKFAGSIKVINPIVDNSTRMVAVQATIPNPTNELRSGMYAEVTVTLPEVQNVLAVPITSVNFAPFGDTLYIVESKRTPEGKELKTVRQQIVKTGVRSGDQIAIVDGLKVGEEVVSSGGFKLRPGISVAVNTRFTPGNDLNPHPSDS